MSRIYALSSVKVQCWYLGCVKKWQIWGMSVGLWSNSASPVSEKSCKYWYRSRQGEATRCRGESAQGSVIHQVQGSNVLGARQPDRPLKPDRLFVVSLSEQVVSERLDKFPFSMSSPFCHFLYLYLLREDFSIFHSLAILHLLARLSKSFWIWIWIRAYNVQSSSTPFSDKIQLNFVISLPWVRFKSHLGYKWMTESWDHQTWDVSDPCFIL